LYFHHFVNYLSASGNSPQNRADFVKKTAAGRPCTWPAQRQKAFPLTDTHGPALMSCQHLPEKNPAGKTAPPVVRI